MSLKKFSELTVKQKEKVKVMYSDLTSQEQYLYNFDDNGDYHGRQYAPPSGVDEKVGPYGTVLAESTVPELKVTEDPVKTVADEEKQEEKKLKTRSRKAK